MLRAVLCGGRGGSSGVRTHILLNWRRKLVPQPARANGYDQVARSLSLGLRMRCLAATRVSALGVSNRRLFADGREERRLWSSRRPVQAAASDVSFNGFTFCVLGDAWPTAVPSRPTALRTSACSSASDNSVVLSLQRSANERHCTLSSAKARLPTTGPPSSREPSSLADTGLAFQRCLRLFPGTRETSAD